MTEVDKTIEVEQFREQAKINLELAEQFIQFKQTEAFKAFISKHLDTSNLVRNLAIVKTQEERDTISLILAQIGFVENLINQPEEVKKNCEEFLKASEEELAKLFEGND